MSYINAAYSNTSDENKTYAHKILLNAVIQYRTWQ
jgi:hypothetical protein